MDIQLSLEDVIYYKTNVKLYYTIDITTKNFGE